MRKLNLISTLTLATLFLSSSVIFADSSTTTKPGETLQIDVPVKIQKANVVFNMEHVVKDGDTTVGLHHIEILADQFKNDAVDGKIIAIFRAEAGSLLLDDKAYNAFNKVTTGNPYKNTIVKLMSQGVQIELCGVTAKAKNWVNADLIPGVKIDTHSIGRLTQLASEGYIIFNE